MVTPAVALSKLIKFTAPVVPIGNRLQDWLDGLTGGLSGGTWDLNVGSLTTTGAITAGTVVNAPLVSAGAVLDTGLTAGAMVRADGTKTLASLANGTADQVLGMTHAATGQEYKSIVGTANEVDVTQTANQIQIGIVDPLITGKGGTGNDWSAAAANAIPVFSSIGTMGLILTGANKVLVTDGSGVWSASSTIPIGAVNFITSAVGSVYFTIGNTDATLNDEVGWGFEVGTSAGIQKGVVGFRRVATNGRGIIFLASNNTNDNTTNVSYSDAVLYVFPGSGVGIGSTTDPLAAGVLNVGTGYRVGNAAASGNYLRGNGTNFVSNTIQAADVPTLNQNTSGTAATVTTNANMTGPITGTGNVTSITSQTGTGTKFVVDTSPTLVTPTLGVATGTSLFLGSTTDPAASAIVTPFLTVQDSTTANTGWKMEHFGSGKYPAFQFYHAPGTHSAFTSSVDTEELGRLVWQGADGAGTPAFAQAATIRVLVQGSPTAGVVAGKMQLMTANTSGTMTAFLTGDNAQAATFANTVNATTFVGALTGNASTATTAGTITSTLPILSGGTGQTTKAAAFDALQPMSALGDTIYGGAAGTGTRLAGNITATRNFLRQTGTGAVSAAPAWDTITTGDVGATATPTASTIPLWDANVNFSANNIIEGWRTTATGAGTTTLTITDKFQQYFTGSSTQTVVLPTTSVVAGGQYQVVNSSSGLVTVQSSGTNTIIILAANTSAIFTALKAAPTAAADWSASYMGATAASSGGLTTSGAFVITLTATGTTGVTLPTSGTLQTTTGTPAGFVIASQATGDLLYASSATAWARLGIQASTYILVGGTTPAWSNAPAFAATNLTGTAASLTAGKATALATARTIGGVSFDGTASTTVATATGGFTVTGGATTCATRVDITFATGCEFRLGNTFSRVATADAAGAFGGGYNLDWNGGSPRYDSTGAISGHGFSAGGTYAIYTGGSQSAGTAATAALSINSSRNTTLAGTLGSGAITSTGLVKGTSFEQTTAATASVLATVTNKIAIVANGVTYYLLASTSAT